MGPFSKPELISFVYALLPGFLSAWIFYGLSAYPKPSSFERVIQALVFTLLAEITTQGIRFICLFVGNHFLLGYWTEDVHFGWKVASAGFIGLFAVIVVQNNLFSKIPDRFRITSKTAYPSEWFSAFTRSKSFVYLHLTGERRLRGWPEEWPDDPSRGHFVMMEAQWVLCDNTLVPLALTERILIPVSEVERVEFEKLSFTEEDVENARLGAAKLVEYNKRIEESKTERKEDVNVDQKDSADKRGLEWSTAGESH